MSATSLPLIFSSEIFTYGNLRSVNQKVCAFIVHLITITLPISYGLDGPGTSVLPYRFTDYDVLFFMYF